MTPPALARLFRLSTPIPDPSAEPRPRLWPATLSLQRRAASLRQLFAAWRLVCHRHQLLRQALDRLTRHTKRGVFGGWRQVAAASSRRRALLQVGVCCAWHEHAATRSIGTCLTSLAPIGCCSLTPPHTTGCRRAPQPSAALACLQPLGRGSAAAEGSAGQGAGGAAQHAAAAHAHRCGSVASLRAAPADQASQGGCRCPPCARGGLCTRHVRLGAVHAGALIVR